MPSDSLESATAWRLANLDVTKVKGIRVGGNSGVSEAETVSETETDVEIEQLNLESTDAGTLFVNARAMKQKAEALQAAAEHEKFIGELVLLDEMEKIIAERGKQFRDGLITCSRSLSTQLVNKQSAKEIEAMLNSEFRMLLEDFSNLPIGRS